MNRDLEDFFFEDRVVTPKVRLLDKETLRKIGNPYKLELEKFEEAHKEHNEKNKVRNRRTRANNDSCFK